MKKIYLTIILSSFIINHAFCQPGIPCNINTFWGITGGQVQEWFIMGTTVTSNGTIVTAPSPGNSLAFCDNLAGGTFSPTFYSHSGNNAVYYDGTSWITDPSVSNCTLSNSAGAGNYLYYNVYGQSCLDRFNGTSFVQIYSSPSLQFTIADLAVDDAGNAWCLMGFSTSNTDSIMVISPSGQVINQFAFSMNTVNGYGCFLMDAALYVAFGSGNPIYPNTLLPVTFTSTAAIPGTPISFSSTALDLASCNAGVPLAVAQNHNPPEADAFSVYPNIASDYINCSLTSKTKSAMQLTITNALGEVIYSKLLQNQSGIFECRINIGNFSKVIYFASIDTGIGRAIKKFI